MSRSRVVLGISGGVDSAVAALLLRDAGHDVHALFMRNWDGDEDDYCTTAQDLQDARRVCEDLDLPLHTVDFASEYLERVFGHFLSELTAGRTPNPDVLCNREIKFGICFEHARRLGADWFATGHYARVGRNASGQPVLLRAIDRDKDQTYFLHSVTRDALERTMFPLGELTKRDVRSIARDRGLAVHEKRDSTGICFIGERPFAKFLSEYLPARPGDIETTDGERIGHHRGLMYYTIGQRQGLEIGGVRGTRELPWYVAAKDLARNALIVVQDTHHDLLMSTTFSTAPATWISGAPPWSGLSCSVKVRYRQADQPCTLSVLAEGRCRVRTRETQRAVTPGQSAVFYDGDLCLGGGVIDTVVPLSAHATADGAATA